MKLIDNLKKIIFGTNENISLADIRFWLLLVVINCGANMGFNYYFEQQKVKIILFLICLCYIILNSHYKINIKQFIFTVSLCFLLFIQSLYVSFYSITTSIHYMLMISIAIMIISICGDRFCRYFSSIIFVYAVISLLCYILSNIFKVTIPFIPITETNIDGGQIMRVFNLYFTQLGNPMDGNFFRIRNCGPFWEPGAYQGFLNISLWFELTMNLVRDKWWKLRVIVLIITILTTLSTGGYIVLFVILLYFFSNDNHIAITKKIFISLCVLFLSIYLYFTLDFMSEKIYNDDQRLAFSFTDFPNNLYMFFGYGYDPDSFRNSSMSSASSIFNLLRYLGITGFIIYIGNLFFNKTPHPFMFFSIVILILTNEPFLSNSMIWWGMAFISYEKYKNNLSIIR